MVRTKFEMDQVSFEETMRTAGVNSKREAVELGLNALVCLGRQAEARKLRGKLGWTGDLEAMRTDK